MSRSTLNQHPTRRLPIGAELYSDHIHFRVWAPRHQRGEVVLFDNDGGIVNAVALRAEEEGYFSTDTPGGAGQRYAYRFDAADRWYADPASRFQPLGPEGPSEVVDPNAFTWTDADWRGVPPSGQVIYEMHVGTFTPEGTFAAAMRELPELARIGVTLLEIMPVADFVGDFGWGYDGVNFFAPTRLYGSPDDFRRFVNRAHEVGLGVVLDVVYNHFGPVGNYLRQFADAYFADRYTNEWGAALNFDDEQSAPVREFFLSNSRYWIEEFHLDGYRYDATHTIYDVSDKHILAAVVEEARNAAPNRQMYFVAENQPQDAKHVCPACEGGFGMAAIWNDDFHHSARVRATSRMEGYYEDYLGTPGEFVAALKHGLLYQGQRSYHRRRHHGSPMRGYPAHALVNFLQNHDQVANSLWGERLHQITSPGRFRALTTLLLLAPQTPMLFQGQEFCASSPFQYFADHEEELGQLVAAGRKQFLAQFPSIATVAAQAAVPDPCDPATFERCKLKLEERETHRAAYQMHIDLLALRRQDSVIGRDGVAEVDGTVLGDDSLAIRYFTQDGRDRLLLVNFGRDLHLAPIPEPLLATPANRDWELLFGSESPMYGGQGVPKWEVEDGWRLAAESAILLHAVQHKK